jgi:hypothetical protein
MPEWLSSLVKVKSPSHPTTRPLFTCLSAWVGEWLGKRKITHPPSHPTTQPLFTCLVLLLSLITPAFAAASEPPRPSASLQSYTGILDMPTARVMPDWSLRINYSHADPYRYYGGAVGIWNRLEFHGQFTQVTTLPGFVDAPEYGDYKDRAAGGRLVLKKEDHFWPQIAVGFFDATGTALFGSRYLVASRMFGNVDLTFGLGQGILAGQFIPDHYRGDDKAYGFLTSSPSRKTRPFGGAEWHVSSRLTLATEYTPIDYSNMFGFRDKGGELVKTDDSRYPVNFGIKYQVKDFLHARVAYLRGNVWAGGIGMEFPLGPEGMLPWKKIEPTKAGERLRWQAHDAENDELARIVAHRLKGEGFGEVVVAAGDTTIWIEARNTVHLADSQALGHLAAAAEPILPPRIELIYLNLKRHGQIIQSLRTSRGNLSAFLASRQDKEGFFAFADLELYGKAHWRQFRSEEPGAPLFHQPYSRFSYDVQPRLKTFLNNRRGFFKHKGIVQARGNYELWRGGRLAGEFELTFFNQFEDLDFDPLEENAVRTDLALYEAKSDPRVSLLAMEQYAELPWSVLGRVSGGIFESAYAGFGAEVFRFFHDGRWGVGLEGATVRKRDLDHNFKLRPDLDQWFTSGFINLYAQLWPAQGVEAGLKAGRFLAGDPGVRFELRRAFRYFTMGAWYTKTDTSIFESEKNRGQSEKGVYIRIPLAIFHDKPIPGHFRYDITSFTRDQGATVRQPSLLYPIDPWATPAHTRRTLEEMRVL